MTRGLRNTFCCGNREETESIIAIFSELDVEEGLGKSMGAEGGTCPGPGVELARQKAEGATAERSRAASGASGPRQAAGIPA